MSAKTKSKINLKLLFFPFVVFLILLNITPITTSLGDRLVVSDNLDVAELLYKVGKLTNIYKLNLDQRFAAINVVRQERSVESEETSFDQVLAEDNHFTNILGASVTIPVLMYHYIRVNPNPADKIGFNLSVTPASFTAQMDYLVSHDYHPIALDQLGAALLGTAQLPSKPIVVTFDDGYKDSYRSAWPILRQRNLKAVNFVITGFVGGPNYLNWEEIDQMKKSGVFTFGSHTVNHSALTYLDVERIKKEVGDSKNILQGHLGYQINWFAYPYGNVNAKVADIVKQSGYLGAFGTNNGIYHDTEVMYTLPRVRIGGGDSVQSFAAKLPWK